MKYMKLAGFIACAALVCAAAAIPGSANAATPDEAAEVARSYGYSEEDIQQAYNEYNENPELYPPEKIDEYIEKLREIHDENIVTVTQSDNVVIPALTTTAIPADELDAMTPEEKEKKLPVTITDSNGETISRISRDAFIDLSYKEKLAYLSTFTPSQQQAIINDLSPDENKSMMKQLPTDQKLQVIDKITEITDDMNLNVTVIDVTDSSVKVAMKNKDGELVSITDSAPSVENTGYDRRWVLAVCSGLFFSAAAGLYVVMRKCFGKTRNGDANE